MAKEFGIENKSFNKPNPEQMDELVANGKTPEQFLSSYEFDETQRDVIVFRRPNERDVQIYDICKFDDNVYGIVVAISSYQFNKISNVTYNFKHFQKYFCEVQKTGLNNKRGDKEQQNDAYQYTLSVVCLQDKAKADSLITLKNRIVGSNSYNIIMKYYQSSNIVEIHKNFYKELL